MAHGIESRVPFLDHKLIELVATVPANVKFQNGELKRLLRVAFQDMLPQAIRERKDRWDSPFRCKSGCAKAAKRASSFLTFRSQNARSRAYLAPVSISRK